MAILGVDVGGTFTDAVLLEDGRVSTGKVLTAPRQEESVLAAARAELSARDQSGRSASFVEAWSDALAAFLMAR